MTQAPRARMVGGLDVGPVGFGAMNLNHAYGVKLPTTEAVRVVHAALDAGVRHVDTAALYGFGSNEEVIGAALAGRREDVVLASKCGMTGVDGTRVIDGRPEALRATLDQALTSLRTDVIDIYYLHRWDKQVPIEESVGALAEARDAGKIRAIGLSEVSAGTIRKAAAVAPIAAVQNEYSLWSRNPELGAHQACTDVGATLVAFSPLGRGILSGAVTDVDALPEKDLRRSMPRFQGEHFTVNLALARGLARIAVEAGCTPAQLALVWLLEQGDDIVVIPGTTSADHARENAVAGSLQVAPEHVAAAGELINERTVSGARYPAGTLAEIDTESFAEVG